MSLARQELIQNAEDAGATQVKFLHDRHSHETSKLYDDDLAEFQVEYGSFQCRVIPENQPKNYFSPCLDTQQRERNKEENKQ